MTTMTRDGRLAHAWRAGKSVYPGLATDYADDKVLADWNGLMIAALARESLAGTFRAHHWDLARSRCCPRTTPSAIRRPRSTTDEATAERQLRDGNVGRPGIFPGTSTVDDAAMISAAPIAEPVRGERHRCRRPTDGTGRRTSCWSCRPAARRALLAAARAASTPDHGGHFLTADGRRALLIPAAAGSPDHRRDGRPPMCVGRASPTLPFGEPSAGRGPSGWRPETTLGRPIAAWGR